MSSPRLRGLSTRVSDDVYTALCTQAKTQGLTLSTLVAHCLATASKLGPATPATEPQADAGAVTATGLDRLVNLERWIQFILDRLLEQDDQPLERTDFPCPTCREPEVMYLESGPGVDDSPPVTGFVCTHYGWQATDHAAYAAACDDQDGERNHPSPAG